MSSDIKTNADRQIDRQTAFQLYIAVRMIIYTQAINLHKKLLYYLDPYGPSRGVRGVYTALVLVLNFTNNLLANCNVFLGNISTRDFNPLEGIK